MTSALHPPVRCSAPAAAPRARRRLAIGAVALAALLAGVAGVLYSLAFGQVSATMGFLPGIAAFTAAVLGGIGSIPGAVLGGLIAEALGLRAVFLFAGAITAALLVARAMISEGAIAAAEREGAEESERLAATIASPAEGTA